LPTPPFWLKIIIFIPVSFVGYATRTFRHSMVRTAYPTMLPHLHPSNVSDGVANPVQPQERQAPAWRVFQPSWSLAFPATHLKLSQLILVAT